MKSAKDYFELLPHGLFTPFERQDVIDLFKAAILEGIQTGFQVAQDSAEICDSNGWHHVEPYIDLKKAREELNKLISKVRNNEPT